MNAVTQTAYFDANAGVLPVTKPLTDVVETYWGYIIKSTEATPLVQRILKAGANFAGVSFIVVAAGLWVLPGSLVDAGLVEMKLGLSFLFFGIATLFLHYAGRGTETELQVDTAAFELREVIRTRSGRVKTLSRFSFDSIGGVFIDREGDKGALMLRYKNSMQLIEAARGSVVEMEQLRDRLGRDLLAHRNREA